MIKNMRTSLMDTQETLRQSSQAKSFDRLLPANGADTQYKQS